MNEEQVPAGTAGGIRTLSFTTSKLDDPGMASIYTEHSVFLDQTIKQAISQHLYTINEIKSELLKSVCEPTDPKNSYSSKRLALERSIRDYSTLNSLWLQM